MYTYVYNMIQQAILFLYNMLVYSLSGNKRIDMAKENKF